VATIGCGGQGPAAEALAVSTCLYQIEFSDQFQGLFAKLFLQKKNSCQSLWRPTIFSIFTARNIGVFCEVKNCFIARKKL
jgi:hypothetical protein